MNHIFIEYEKTGYAVIFGEITFHVETYKEAMKMAIKLGKTMGKVPY